MSSVAAKPRPTPKPHQGQKVRVGNKVGLQWAGRGLIADVIEDRGRLGAHGERVVRLDIAEGASHDERMQIEVPVQFLALVTRVGSVYLRNEAGGLEDVSNEVVAVVNKDKLTDPWRLELHFGLTGHRSGFVGHQYGVTVPTDAAQLVPKESVENGYQLGGTLNLKTGKIVIDDPITRPKPPGTRISYVP